MKSPNPQGPPPAATLTFERELRTGSYFISNSEQQLTEVSFEVELRRDPLTRRSGRVAHFQGFQLVPPDLAAAVAASRSRCPFCPDRIERVTPQLAMRSGGHGRIHVGQAVVFPNLSPYDRHSFVDVVTRDHYVRPEEFRPDQLCDSLLAAQRYFGELPARADGAYELLTWNYMPPAGATQVHPHLQGFVTDRPGTLLEEEVRCGLEFYRHRHRSYWDLLVDEEERSTERFLTRASHTAWLTAFVSRSVLSDVFVIFPSCRTVTDVPEEGLWEFSHGLCACLRFLASEGVAAFNLAFYGGPGGDTRDRFRLHARLSPRIYFNPAIQGSDTTAWHQLLDEPFMVRSPEALAAALRPALQAALTGIR